YIDTYVNELMTEEDFKSQQTVIHYHTGSRILIVDKNNMVQFDSESSSDTLVGSILKSDYFSFNEDGSSINQMGSFDPYEEDHIISVSMPVMMKNEVIASVMVYLPYPSVKEDIKYVYGMTFFSVLFIFLITFVATYFFSMNMNTSFKEISHTAREIANGNFSTRVDPSEFSKEMDELAASLNYMAEELEKLEDLRRDFIANISHDFRSPLTSIRGYAQAIMDGTIPVERQEKYLNVIISESDRLTKLTNDILLLTKMENDVLKPEFEDFDLHEAIRNVLLQFEQKILEKKLHLILLIEAEEIFVNADFNQIQRVITNLLDNAIKFCRIDDEVTIETTLSGDKVTVAITDSGPGISEEDIKDIWNRFHKVDRSRGMDKKGVGLGLSIVREIIKLHNENINVYSHLGKGTTFSFTLARSKKATQ
ncbi:MAG: HAMP domain-containing histidine kinase, partial [Vallitaleaceae bacterium]|nr:HAMP domain-containing histidine kinase [Vallitaleaceae bacterium]